jgi:peptidoglycan/LPS O-acetylase OafA/YrhL
VALWTPVIGASFFIAALKHRPASGRSNQLVSRALGSAPVAWIGRISYSLYLWQQPFLDRHVHATLTTFPINVTGALVCAVLSFVCIEKPALRLRGCLVRPRSRPRPATSLAVPAAPIS